MPDEVWDEYALDQEINDRGVQIDMQFVKSAITIDTVSRSAALQKMRGLTELDNPNSVAQMKHWLADNGMETDTLGKKAVTKLLENASPLLGNVLSLRQSLAKSSVKKYTALELLYDSVPEVLSELIRTAFVPKDGHKFIIADFSAIEARAIAWFAGESWRNEVFAGHGKIYEASASQMFGSPRVTYEGVSSAKKWGRLDTYEPKLVENIVQATSRDILSYAMQALRNCAIVMHVHDEVVIEADHRLSTEDICRQMSQTPPWAPGLLLRADGFETNFYNFVVDVPRLYRRRVPICQ